MKILDRYISSSVAAAFLSGVAMFVVLLCAMDLMKELITLITKYGVPAKLALTIFAFKVPGTLVYTLPMAVLLGILLTFSRMSSESEMVAIRAAGVSFVRIVIPTLFIALIVAGITFWISNYFAPYASERSAILKEAALKEFKAQKTLTLVSPEVGVPEYSIVARDLDARTGVLRDVTMVYFTEGVPRVVMSTDLANWDRKTGQWRAHAPLISVINLNTLHVALSPLPHKNSQFDFKSNILKLDKDPATLEMSTKDPADCTSASIRHYIAELKRDPVNNKLTIGKWSTRLAQRYSTPFTCLVFALIAAPLGLRHHRASSAVGLGVSLLIIFIYYFISVYISTFGDSGTISPTLAAWLPNGLGAVLGIGLIIKANR